MAGDLNILVGADCSPALSAVDQLASQVNNKTAKMKVNADVGSATKSAQQIGRVVASTTAKGVAQGLTTSQQVAMKQAQQMNQRMAYDSKMANARVVKSAIADIKKQHRVQQEVIKADTRAIQRQAQEAVKARKVIDNYTAKNLVNGSQPSAPNYDKQVKQLAQRLANNGGRTTARGGLSDASVQTLNKLASRRVMLAQQQAVMASTPVAANGTVNRTSSQMAQEARLAQQTQMAYAQRMDENKKLMQQAQESAKQTRAQRQAQQRLADNQKNLARQASLFRTTQEDYEKGRYTTSRQRMQDIQLANEEQAAYARRNDENKKAIKQAKESARITGEQRRAEQKAAATQRFANTPYAYDGTAYRNTYAPQARGRIVDVAQNLYDTNLLAQGKIDGKSVGGRQAYKLVQSTAEASQASVNALKTAVEKNKTTARQARNTQKFGETPYSYDGTAYRGTYTHQARGRIVDVAQNLYDANLMAQGKIDGKSVGGRQAYKLVQSTEEAKQATESALKSAVDRNKTIARQARNVQNLSSGAMGYSDSYINTYTHRARGRAVDVAQNLYDANLMAQGRGVGSRATYTTQTYTASQQEAARRRLANAIAKNRNVAAQNRLAQQQAAAAQAFASTPYAFDGTGYRNTFTPKNNLFYSDWNMSTAKGLARSAASKVGRGVSGFGNKLIGMSSRINFSSFYGDMMVLSGATSVLKSMYEQTKLVDDQMRQLKKIMPETWSSNTKQVDKSIDAVAKFGLTIGKTKSEMIESTMYAVRSGYSSFSSAEVLAEQAALLSTVADEEQTIQDASDSIVAGLKGFGVAADDTSVKNFATHYVDSLNAVSNAFAVTSNDISDALPKFMSSMNLNLTGTDTERFDKSIAMLTAISEINRNPSKAARGLNTIASRYTQMDDSTSTTGAKLKKWYKEQGIDVRDQTGELRDFYDVISDVQAKWDDLSQSEKNEYMLAQAGANQRQQLSALLENSVTMQEAYATAVNSTGSAEKSALAMMDSITGKEQILAATWQDFSEKGLGASLAKGGLTVATKSLQFFDNKLAATTFTVGTATVAAAALVKIISNLGGMVLHTFGTSIKGTVNGVRDLAAGFSLLAENQGMLGILGGLAEGGLFGLIGGGIGLAAGESIAHFTTLGRYDGKSTELGSKWASAQEEQSQYAIGTLEYAKAQAKAEKAEKKFRKQAEADWKYGRGATNQALIQYKQYTNDVDENGNIRDIERQQIAEKTLKRRLGTFTDTLAGAGMSTASLEEQVATLNDVMGEGAGEKYVEVLETLDMVSADGTVNVEALAEATGELSEEAEALNQAMSSVSGQITTMSSLDSIGESWGKVAKDLADDNQIGWESREAITNAFSVLDSDDIDGLLTTLDDKTVSMGAKTKALTGAVEESIIATAGGINNVADMDFNSLEDQLQYYIDAVKATTGVSLGMDATAWAKQIQSSAKLASGGIDTVNESLDNIHQSLMSGDYDSLASDIEAINEASGGNLWVDKWVEDLKSGKKSYQDLINEIKKNPLILEYELRESKAQAKKVEEEQTKGKGYRRTTETHANISEEGKAERKERREEKVQTSGVDTTGSVWRESREERETRGRGYRRSTERHGGTRSTWREETKTQTKTVDKAAGGNKQTVSTIKLTADTSEADAKIAQTAENTPDAKPMTLTADGSQANAEVTRTSALVQAFGLLQGVATLSESGSSTVIAAAAAAAAAINSVPLTHNTVFGGSVTQSLHNAVAKVKAAISELAAAKTAKGDTNFAGGATWLGDQYNGTGSYKPELVVTPDGRAALYGTTGWEMAYLPRGTRIYNNSQTQKLLGKTYASGNMNGVRFANGNMSGVRFADGNSTVNTLYEQIVFTGKDDVKLADYIKDINEKLDDTVEKWDTITGILEDQITLQEYYDDLTDQTSETTKNLYAQMLKTLEAEKASLASLGATVDNSKDYRAVLKDIAEYKKKIADLDAAAYERQVRLNEFELKQIQRKLDGEGNSETKLALYDQNIANLKQKQQYAHDEAERLRSLGYGEDSEEIMELKEVWWDCYDSITDACKESSDIIQKAMEDQLDINEKALNYIVTSAEHFEDYLTEQEDALKDQWALEDHNREREEAAYDRMIELSNAQADLAEATKKRTMVMNEEGVWEWQSSTKEVLDAQKSLEEILRNQQKAIDEEKRSDDRDEKLYEIWKQYYGDSIKVVDQSILKSFAATDSVYTKVKEVNDQLDRIAELEQQIAYFVQYGTDIDSKNAESIVAATENAEDAVGKYTMGTLNQQVKDYVYDQFGVTNLTPYLDKNGYVDIQKVIDTFGDENGTLSGYRKIKQGLMGGDKLTGGMLSNAGNTYKVNSNGKAPSGLNVGDSVVTAGGTYKITKVKADGSYESTLVSSGSGYTTSTYEGSYANASNTITPTSATKSYSGSNSGGTYNDSSITINGGVDVIANNSTEFATNLTNQAKSKSGKSSSNKSNTNAAHMALIKQKLALSQA